VAPSESTLAGLTAEIQRQEQRVKFAAGTDGEVKAKVKKAPSLPANPMTPGYPKCCLKYLKLQANVVACFLLDIH